MQTLGLDIGGSKIGVGVVEFGKKIRRTASSYKLLKYEKIVTGKNVTATALIKIIKNAVAKHLTPSTKAIGVGVAGQVDFRKGVLRHGPNLPKAFDGLKLRAILEKEFRVLVTVDNDAHCFAYAEAVYGAGRGYDAVFGMTLGTGVGGGLVMNGEIDRGATNTVGEIGHMYIGGESICSCGHRGHVEARAGGHAMMERYRRLTDKKLVALDLERLYKKSDKNAVEIVEAAAVALAAGIANVLVLINPNCIVLGGGLSRFSALIKRTTTILPQFLPFPILKKTPVLISVLGDTAGILGAALLATKHTPSS